MRRRRRPRRIAGVGAALAGLVVVVACTETERAAPATTSAPATAAPTTGAATATTDAGDAPDTSAATTTVADDGSIVAAFAGRPWAFGTLPAAASPADTAAEPVVVGMINQEDTPIGSFPEMRHAVEAAVAWINAELGGVGGRPIRLETCITDFAVEQSQACAQRLVQQGAVAVMSGIDITSSGSVPVLQQNGVPLVSAVPTTLAELRGDGVFSFSGGVTGAYVAFAADAAANGAESIALAFGDFDSFSVPAREYGATVAERLGLEVTLIPFPIVTTDFLPVVRAAIDSGADAVAIGAADSACAPVMTTLADLGYAGRVYLVGACAAGEILGSVHDAVQAGVIFNSEGPVESGTDGELFLAVTERYSPDPAGGAGTVAFRAAMNLWRVLDEVAATARPTPALVGERLRGAVASPSFWGHPYTCDGRQVPGMPALCSPQQTLFRLPDDSGTFVPVSDGWIDVPALVASTG